MINRINTLSHHHQFIKINFRKASCVLIILFLVKALAGCTTQPKPEVEVAVSAAVVQLQISEEIFASPAMFKAVIRSTIEEAFEKGTPDIIIFPEYTSVFIALFPYMNAIFHSGSPQEALEEIRKDHRDITSIQSVFMKQSSYVEQTMQSIFGELANEFDIMIVAGSYFAAENNKLFNRLAVYNESGMRVYTQDKVFLTPIERNIIKLSSGDIRNATGLYLKNRRLVFTICRDSLEPVWTDHFGKADIWIDIKANGAEFTEAEEESFSRFMPARLADAEIPYGITACLTGTFLDYFWEGKSAVFSKKSVVKTMIKAQKADTQEVIVIALP